MGPTTMHIVRDARARVVALVALILLPTLIISACAPPQPQSDYPDPDLSATSYDPALWREKFPQQYEDWAATAEQRPGGSRYKRSTQGVAYDKLSEYPFLSALAKGFGFSVEFNEPNGHARAFTDQHVIDPARLKAGGVCLACKTPYYDQLQDQQGEELLSMPYEEAVNLIPEKDRDLGVSCRDCHNPKDNSLHYMDLMGDALNTLDAKDPSENQMRNVVCGQCHSTYAIEKTDGKATDLFMPWEGGSYGDVSVENIIETIEGDSKNLEWTQELTGLKLGYIRHPEFELYTRRSIHYVNGVTCVDCHQPYKIEDDKKVSDHNVMSPLDNQMQACRPCHPGRTTEQLKEDVFHIQDNFIGALLNAGYSAVANAQLIRLVNESNIPTTGAESEAYGRAVQMYKQAFYRVAYSAGENSVGFHNPPEANRILADALAYSTRADQILREILARNGIEAPAEVDLQLLTYLENRGVRKLKFKPEQEFKDPRGTAEVLWRDNLRALRGGRSQESTAQAQ